MTEPNLDYRVLSPYLGLGARRGQDLRPLRDGAYTAMITPLAQSSSHAASSGDAMQLQTIVVGFDGSHNAQQALKTAVELVPPSGTVHVVTAFHLPSTGETNQVLRSLPKEFRDSYDPLQAPRSHLGNAEAFLKTAGVQAKGHFVEDHPAAAILQVATDEHADLIVVGSRGLGRGTRFLRGSVSSRVAAHAETSFLVVHDDDVSVDD